MFKFIEKLQNSDEGNKRRWMFILSSISMVIVVFVWLAYFNNLISDFSRQQPQETKNGGFTFSQTMKNGAAIVYETIAGWMKNFGEILGAPREYIINPN